MTNQPRYVVVPAPGRYGDETRVISSHRTLIAAARQCGDGGVVRAAALRRGDRWLRVYEMSPILHRGAVVR